MDVSAIVAVRNGAPTLRRCLDSILAQEGCDLEVIVVDGMSDDETPAIVSSYTDRRVRSIREPDTGVYGAWNKALEAARGQWCIFLGCDDYLAHHQALRTLVEATEDPRASDVVLAYGRAKRREEGPSLYHHRDAPSALRWLLRGRMIPHQAVIHRTSALHAIGGFDPRFRIAGDRDACIRLLRVGSATATGSVVAIMSPGGMSTDPRLASIQHKERREVLRRHRGPVVATGYFWMWKTRRLFGRILGEYLRSKLQRALDLLSSGGFFRAIGRRSALHGRPVRDGLRVEYGFCRKTREAQN